MKLTHEPFKHEGYPQSIFHRLLRVSEGEKLVLMGHKDLKTTMRYIRAGQLQREVRPLQLVHKLAK